MPPTPPLSPRALVALALAGAAGLAPAALAQATGELQSRVQYQNRDGQYADCDMYRLFYSVNGTLLGHVDPPAGTFAGFRTSVAPVNGMLNWKVTPYALSAGIGRVTDGAGLTHRYTVTPSYPVNTSAQLTIQTVNSNITGQAFVALRPIVVENKFFKTLGARLPFTQVSMHEGVRGSGSFYRDLADPFIQLDPNDVHSVDVIMHEYAHMVGFKNKMSKARDAGVPGDHHFGADNIKGGASVAFGGAFSAKGRKNGSLYGYSEGVATFLGNMAKMEGNMAAAGWPARDCVPQYYQLNAAGNAGLWSADLETRDTWDASRPSLPNVGKHRNFVGLGEGDELSVARALWDFYDGHGASGTTNEAFPRAGRADRINYKAQRTWDQVLTDTSMFREAWTNIAADLGTVGGRATVTGLTTRRPSEAVAAAGETLEGAGISHLPVTTGAVAKRPLLMWDEQNNGNSSWFRTLIFDLAWNLKYDSGLQSDPTPGTLGRERFTVTENLAAGDYRWVVLNDPANAMRAELEGPDQRFSWYWSGANAITVAVPGPGTFALILAAGLTAIRRRRP